MTTSTADRVLAALAPYDLKDEGNGKWRSNSPLRPGSNSHAFCLRIDGPEHGAYYDQVSGESGSLYTLAGALSVPVASKNATPPPSEVVYCYTDAAGVPLFEVLRYYDRQGVKQFVQRQPGGKKLPNGKHGRGSAPLVLYRLPEVLAAIQAGQPIYIVEGEKDVETLRLCGLTATCNAGGAGKWKSSSYNAALRGADAIILPDNDQPGTDHAAQVAAALHGKAAQVRIVPLPGLPPKGDVSDWIAAGHTLAELQALVAAAPPYTPTPPPAPAAAQPPAGPGPTAALAAALEQHGYYCALNTETDEITVNGDLLSDIALSLIRADVRDRNLGDVNILNDAITLQAHGHRVAPIRDGLAALQWDGRPHIAELAACLHTSDEQIRYADGAHRSPGHAFLLRWLLGAVGRVLNGEQNLMLVLDGPQGIGKSAWAKWLGSILPGTFCEESINPQDKDCLLRLTKTLVWEAGELDQATRKHDAAALKHFLTRSTVTARRAYGRNDIQKGVLASFIGTVNTNGNGFLSDPTGNRRYLVLTLKGIKWSYSQIDPKQVWAEAVARYKAGERGTLTPEEAAYRDRVNREEHQTTGLMDDWLAMYFEVTKDGRDLLTSGEIVAHLQTKDITLGGNDRAAAMAIADALTRAGVKRADRRASKERYSDYRRAWAGIAVRIPRKPSQPAPHGGYSDLDDAANQPDDDEPTLNQPPAKVGSPRPNAVSVSSDPTDPTLKAEKSTGEGVEDDQSTHEAPESKNAVRRSDQVGSQHQDAVIQPSPGLDRLDQAGSFHEALSASGTYRRLSERKALADEYEQLTGRIPPSLTVEALRAEVERLRAEAA